MTIESGSHSESSLSDLEVLGAAVASARTGRALYAAIAPCVGVGLGSHVEVCVRVWTLAPPPSSQPFELGVGVTAAAREPV